MTNEERPSIDEMEIMLCIGNLDAIETAIKRGETAVASEFIESQRRRLKSLLKCMDPASNTAPETPEGFVPLDQFLAEAQQPAPADDALRQLKIAHSDSIDHLQKLHDAERARFDKLAAAVEGVAVKLDGDPYHTGGKSYAATLRKALSDIKQGDKL